MDVITIESKAYHELMGKIEKILRYVEKEEKAKTPQIAETKTLSTSREATVPAIPKTRKIHQHFVPQ